MIQTVILAAVLTLAPQPTAPAPIQVPVAISGTVVTKWYEGATRPDFYGLFGQPTAPECWGLDVQPDGGLLNRPVCVAKPDWDRAVIGGHLSAPELRHAIWRHFS